MPLAAQPFVAALLSSCLSACEVGCWRLWRFQPHIALGVSFRPACASQSFTTIKHSSTISTMLTANNWGAKGARAPSAGDTLAFKPGRHQVILCPQQSVRQLTSKPPPALYDAVRGADVKALLHVEQRVLPLIGVHWQYSTSACAGLLPPSSLGPRKPSQQRTSTVSARPVSAAAAAMVKAISSAQAVASIVALKRTAIAAAASMHPSPEPAGSSPLSAALGGAPITMAPPSALPASAQQLLATAPAALGTPQQPVAVPTILTTTWARAHCIGAAAY
jgi:hypothetical protein